MRIGRKQKEKFDWSIKYIKSEHKTGRHFNACLGSAGFNYQDDIRALEEYSRSIGENEFADLLENRNL